MVRNDVEVPIFFKNVMSLLFFAGGGIIHCPNSYSKRKDFAYEVTPICVN